MAWKETGIVEQRLDFVREYLSQEWNMSELCRRYGITRRTGYKWVERYEQEGLEGRDMSSKLCLSEKESLMSRAVLWKRSFHRTWKTLPV